MLDNRNLHGTEKNSSIYLIFGKTGQLEKKEGRVKKERKNKFHKSFFVDLTSIIQIIKFT